MRYFKAVGLCLVAVFAVTAVAVASASAEVPTFLFNNNATATGNFHSHTGEGTLTTAGGHFVTCLSAENEGRAVPGTDQVEKVKITFKGCFTEEAGKRIPCKSGETAELIDTNLLHGNLGYITKEPLLVGLLLLPEAAGGLFAEFKCELGVIKIPVKVRGRNGGGIIADVLPNSVEKLLDPGEDGELTIEQSKAGLQKYTSLEVLGVLHDELLLEAELGSGERTYELSSIQEHENVKVLFEESVKITG